MVLLHSIQRIIPAHCFLAFFATGAMQVGPPSKNDALVCEHLEIILLVEAHSADRRVPLLAVLSYGNILLLCEAHWNKQLLLLFLGTCYAVSVRQICISRRVSG